MRRWDVELVDLAAIGKCGSRIGLAGACACSACEVELAGGPNFKLPVILVTAVGPGNYLGLSVCQRTPTRKAASRRDKGVWCGLGTMRVLSVVLCDAGHEGPAGRVV